MAGRPFARRLPVRDGRLAAAGTRARRRACSIRPSSAACSATAWACSGSPGWTGASRPAGCRSAGASAGRAPRRRTRTSPPSRRSRAGRPACWPTTSPAACSPKSRPPRGAAVHALAFRREVETAIYDSLPLGLDRRLRLHPPRCPLALVAGRQSREVRQVGLRATLRHARGRVDWIDGTHLFPFERPAEAAGAVLGRLRGFAAGEGADRRAARRPRAPRRACLAPAGRFARRRGRPPPRRGGGPPPKGEPILAVYQHGTPARGAAARNDQVRLRHRRRGVLARQGHRGGVARGDPRVARPRRHAHQARPLPQRRSGHDEPVPARRGVRHRRRRRDRPRPRPLRALHHHPDAEVQQLHRRADLPERAREGAPRRLPRQDGAGDPARHQRDPGVHPARRGAHAAGRQGPPERGHRRDRRHGGRHRVAAVPGGGAPDEPAPGPEQHRLRAPDLRAVDRRRRRAEDQADAAHGAEAARDRHAGRRPAVPRRPRHPRRGAREDLAVHQRARVRRHLGVGRRHHLQGAAHAARAGARRADLRQAAPAHAARPTCRAGTAWCTRSSIRATR